MSRSAVTTAVFLSQASPNLNFSSILSLNNKQSFTRKKLVGSSGTFSILGFYYFSLFDRCDEFMYLFTCTLSVTNQRRRLRLGSSFGGSGFESESGHTFFVKPNSSFLRFRPKIRNLEGRNYLNVKFQKITISGASEPLRGSYPIYRMNFNN